MMDSSGSQLLGDSGLGIQVSLSLRQEPISSRGKEAFLIKKLSRESPLGLSHWRSFCLQQAPSSTAPRPGHPEHHWASAEVGVGGGGGLASRPKPLETWLARDPAQSWTLSSWLRKGVSRVDLKAASKIQRSPPSIVPPFQR